MVGSAGVGPEARGRVSQRALPEVLEVAKSFANSHHGGHNTVVPGEISRFIRHIRSKDATMPGRHRIGVVDRLQPARM